MIDKAALIEMFQNIEQNGLSANEELLWGHFFADHDQEKLETLVPALEGRGFRFVDLYEAEPDDEAQYEPLYCLHVEKAERHSVDSLEQRTRELYALADQYGIESYDGMEVGPLEGDSFEIYESNNCNNAETKLQRN